MTGKEAYAAKLFDPRWIAKRNRIAMRDGHACRLCLAEHGRRDVHHIRYTGEPWEAPDEDLMTLCERCHKFVEARGDNMITIPVEFWLMSERHRNLDRYGFNHAVQGFCEQIDKAGLKHLLYEAANKPEAAEL